MSDIMDEFEFKPLTEGLGFHKKNPPKATMSMSSNTELSTPVASQVNSQVNSQLNSALSTPLSSPLPRSEPKKISKESVFPSTTVDEILKTLQDKKRPQFVTNTARPRIEATPEPIKFKTSTWDFSAFMLDFMLVLASNLVCLIVLLLTTRVDLFSNLYNPDSAGMIYLSLASMFVGIAWVYLVVNRVFLGCTPGEWVFDQRLGTPEETGSAIYCLQIVVRTTILMATGMIVFPIISALMNQDVLGRWLGLEMLKKA